MGRGARYNPGMEDPVGITPRLHRRTECGKHTISMSAVVYLSVHLCANEEKKVRRCGRYLTSMTNGRSVKYQTV